MNRMESCDQLAQSKRFGQIVIGSGVKGRDSILFRIAYREDDDTDARIDGANHSAGSYAAHSWHIQIQQSKMKGGVRKHVHSVSTATGLFHTMSTHNERLAQRLAERGFIIDNSYVPNRQTHLSVFLC